MAGLLPNLNARMGRIASMASSTFVWQDVLEVLWEIPTLLAVVFAPRDTTVHKGHRHLSNTHAEKMQPFTVLEVPQNHSVLVALIILTVTNRV